MLHDFRTAYGWTDVEITEHVMLYGEPWLYETWKLIQEDKANHYKQLLTLLPVARTPMDRKAGKSLEKYVKGVRRALDKLTPWAKNRTTGRFASLRDKLKPGEVVVLLEGGENGNLDIFDGVRKIRE